jgi:5-formyltetrahydrofolate cyclo-ligase
VQPRADLLPLAPAQLDVVLVPGVAFDATGGRLGRGGGFYDRFLTQIRDQLGVTIAGVCFDEQIVDSVPMHAHDVRVGMILTPTRTLVVRANN